MIVALTAGVILYAASRVRSPSTPSVTRGIAKTEQLNQYQFAADKWKELSALYSNKQFRRVIEEGRLAIRRLGSRRLSVDIREIVGDAYVQLGELEQAVQQYRDAYNSLSQNERADPFFPFPVKLGNALLAAGKTDEAIGLFGSLLKQHPSRVDFELPLAHALERKGDHRGALRHFLSVLNKTGEDNSPEVVKDIAMAWERLGNMDKARTYWTELKRIGKGNQQFRGWIQIAERHLRSG